jgi:hypothetical protein
MIMINLSPTSKTVEDERRKKEEDIRNRQRILAFNYKLCEREGDNWLPNLTQKILFRLFFKCRLTISLKYLKILKNLISHRFLRKLIRE